MSLNLMKINFIDTTPGLKQENITSFNMTRKENGEIIGIVTTIFGETYIQKITEDGMSIETLIQLPNFSSISERNKSIINFKKNNNNYTQNDIAIIYRLSQSMVSNILKTTKNQ